MQTMINAGRTNAHLSCHERRRLKRTEAFSRRTPAGPREVAVVLSAREVALIERLVGEDRTPVSSALLLVAGIGAPARRQAVLAAVEVANRQARVRGGSAPVAARRSPGTCSAPEPRSR